MYYFIYLLVRDRKDKRLERKHSCLEKLSTLSFDFSFLVSGISVVIRLSHPPVKT
jgi:hypothetical protein